MNTPAANARTASAQVTSARGASPQVTAALRTITTHGLPLALPPAPTKPLDEATWRRLLREVDHYRLPGLLLAAIEDSVLPATDEQYDQARARHLDACTAVLVLERPATTAGTPRASPSTVPATPTPATARSVTSRSCSPEALPDPDRTAALVDRWQAGAVVARTFGLCRDLLGIEVAGPLLQGYADRQPSRRDARAIAAYVGADRRHRRKLLASLPFLDRASRAAFLSRSLRPPPRSPTSR